MSCSCQPSTSCGSAFLIAGEILPKGHSGLLRLEKEYWVVSRPNLGRIFWKKIDLDTEEPDPSLAFRLDRVARSAAKMQKGEFFSRSKYGSPTYHWLICRENDGTYRSVYYGSDTSKLDAQRADLTARDYFPSAPLYTTDPPEVNDEKHQTFRNEFRAHWLFFEEGQYAYGSSFIVSKVDGKVEVRFLPNPRKYTLEGCKLYDMEEMERIHALIPRGYWGRVECENSVLGIGRDAQGCIRKLIDPFEGSDLEEIGFDLRVLEKWAEWLGKKQIYSELNTVLHQHLLMYREGQELCLEMITDDTYTRGFARQCELLGDAYWMYSRGQDHSEADWDDASLAALAQLGDNMGRGQYYQKSIKEPVYVKDWSGRMEKIHPFYCNPAEDLPSDYTEYKPAES